MAQHGIQPRKGTTIVAIDFGTHGTGYAYSINGAAPRLHVDYLDAPRRYPKMRTAICYRNRSAISIGHTALRDYEIKTASPGSSDAAASYRLVDKFKLLLQDPSDSRVPPLPAGINEVQVVADFLDKFRQYVLQRMREELGPASSHLVASDSITWVVTVPAMWTDKAKSAMRDACVRAGLTRRDKPENVVLSLEPEAAALWAKDSRATSFEPGELVMVLDAGGGTVDWSVHSCIERGGQTLLAEAAASQGAMLGSTQLDEAFLAYFREEVGAEAYDAWSYCHKLEVLQLLKQWENIKCLFGTSGTGIGLEQLVPHMGLDFGASEELRVSVPPALHAIMTDEDKANLKVEHGGDDSITLTDETMRGLFDPTVDKIIESTNAQLMQLSGAHGLPAGVDKLLLVGGFSASPYVQQRVRSEVKVAAAAPPVVTMAEPYAAVLRGAVLFGCNPNLIAARRSRYSYGVRACGPYVDGAPKKFWHEEEQCWFSESLFSMFVEQGQSVDCDETVEHYFIPLYRHQTRCEIEMYTMDTRNARFVDDEDPDTRKLADLIVTFDSGDRYDERVIRVTFHFGRTEVTATATDEHSQRTCQTAFRFAS